MGNLKFGLTNLLTQPGAVLKNGTGGGAPPLIETAPYVMANLLSSDRYTLWRTSTLLASTSYNVDFDLGSNQSINTGAMQGYRPASGAGPFVDVYYQTGTYTPGGTWNFLGSIVNLVFNLRDDYVEFSPVTARSVRFVITVGGSNLVFTLGKFFIGSVTDLLGEHSPGATYAPFSGRLETPLPGGAVVLTEQGDEQGEFTIPWNYAPALVESLFLTLQTLRSTQLMIWPDGHVYEVFLKGRRLVQTRARQASRDYELVFGRAA